jgi:hypothetical protein
MQVDASLPLSGSNLTGCDINDYDCELLSVESSSDDASRRSKNVMNHRRTVATIKSIDYSHLLCLPAAQRLSVESYYK